MEDVESDFAVFHGIDDVRSMSGRLFFSRANRLPAYDGAVGRRLVYESTDMEFDSGPGPYVSLLELYTAAQITALARNGTSGALPSGAGTAPGPKPPPGTSTEWVEADDLKEVAKHPVLGNLFEVVEVPPE
jgi:hypothetical protein